MANYRPEDAVLTPGDVAVIFRVDPRTVSRWSNEGRLPSFRTAGGHRRFRRSDVDALIAAGQST